MSSIYERFGNCIEVRKVAVDGLIILGIDNDKIVYYLFELLSDPSSVFRQHLVQRFVAVLSLLQQQQQQKQQNNADKKALEIHVEDLDQQQQSIQHHHQKSLGKNSLKHLNQILSNNQHLREVVNNYDDLKEFLTEEKKNKIKINLKMPSFQQLSQPPSAVSQVSEAALPIVIPSNIFSTAVSTVSQEPIAEVQPAKKIKLKLSLKGIKPAKEVIDLTQDDSVKSTTMSAIATETQNANFAQSNAQDLTANVSDSTVVGQEREIKEPIQVEPIVIDQKQEHDIGSSVKLTQEPVENGQHQVPMEVDSKGPPIKIKLSLKKRE
jgi:hypothetical protein